MKYDILEGLYEYIKQNTNCQNTARKYFQAVKNLFSDLQFNNLNEVSKEELEERLSAIKGKNNFSAAKRGLELLKEYDSDLQLPDSYFFAETSIHKKNHRKRPEPIYIQKTMRKINQIQDKKLKLAYRLALVSGLRVSELETLEPQDLSFAHGNITVMVRHGKGDKVRMVNCRIDPYVYDNLQELVKDIQPSDKIFYSEEKLRKDARNLGIECHDLRRIYAYQHKKELRGEQNTNYQANRVIQANLGHVRYKTTKKYLYGKKFIE